MISSLWQIAFRAVVHEAMMQARMAPRHLVSYAGSGTAVGGGVLAQATSGTVQGAGLAVGICGIVAAFLPVFLPLYFRDRSEKRALNALIAENARLQAESADQKRRLDELEKQAPSIEANRQRLDQTQLKADAAFMFLNERGWLGDQPAEVSGVPIKVLIVEDNQDIARALVRFLGNKGFEVDHAFSVAEANARVSGLVPFDWLILDLKLGDGQGEDVIRYVRSHRPSTCIAVTTGVEEPARLKALEALKPDRVFRKPVAWSSLIYVLRTYCRDEPNAEKSPEPPEPHSP